MVRQKTFSFNPCFGGTPFQTGIGSDCEDTEGGGFNPCFGGTPFQTRAVGKEKVL